MQEEGNRNYQLINEDVKLYAATVRILKEWNKKYPTAIYDSKYLKKLALDVFGKECLARSTVYGTTARSSNVQREPLNLAKLCFVRGKF